MCALLDIRTFHYGSGGLSLCANMLKVGSDICFDCAASLRLVHVYDMMRGPLIPMVIVSGALHTDRNFFEGTTTRKLGGHL